MIVDVKTGERMTVAMAKPKQIEGFIKSLSNPKISELLTQVNFFKRVSEKLEKSLKDYIKGSVELKFDDDGISFFEEHRIKKLITYRFSEKKLMAEGTNEEIAQWISLKKKFTEPAEQLRIE